MSPSMFPAGMPVIPPGMPVTEAPATSFMPAPWMFMPAANWPYSPAMATTAAATAAAAAPVIPAAASIDMDYLPESALKTTKQDLKNRILSLRNQEAEVDKEIQVAKSRLQQLEQKRLGLQQDIERRRHTLTGVTAALRKRTEPASSNPSPAKKPRTDAASPEDSPIESPEAASAVALRAGSEAASEDSIKAESFVDDLLRAASAMPDEPEAASAAVDSTSIHREKSEARNAFIFEALKNKTVYYMGSSFSLPLTKGSFQEYADGNCVISPAESEDKLSLPFNWLAFLPEVGTEYLVKEGADRYYYLAKILNANILPPGKRARSRVIEIEIEWVEFGSQKTTIAYRALDRVIPADAKNKFRSKFMQSNDNPLENGTGYWIPGT